jgi:subtilisin family serine protease
MGDSVRKLALANLRTALGQISVANGYATNITEIGDQAIDWDSVYQKYALPVICVVPGQVRYEYVSKNILVVRQVVSLEFAYEAPTQDDAWDTGDAIIDDIIGAIHVDTTRGGNALHTTIIDAQTDAGNPDLQDSRGGTAAGIVTLELMLSRAWTVTPTPD